MWHYICEGLLSILEYWEFFNALMEWNAEVHVIVSLNTVELLFSHQALNTSVKWPPLTGK